LKEYATLLPHSGSDQALDDDFRNQAIAHRKAGRVDDSLQSFYGAQSAAKSPVKSLHREDRIKDSILRVVNGLPAQDQAWMNELSPRQWRRLLLWMDYHGVALYFLDRLLETKSANLLPVEIRMGLERRLRENTVRTRGMIDESIAIQRKFQASSLKYALLKGASLSPSSAPRPELRLQFDLDFLVAEEDIPKAQTIVLNMGYRFYGLQGRQREFKRNERPGIGLKEIYRDTNSFRVELHSEPPGAVGSSVLERAEWREIGGFAMPTLSPVDFFIGQGLHAFKHVRMQFCRAAYLVEFRRHVIFRSGDQDFWADVERRASGDFQVCLKLGLVIGLITEVMGEFAPDSLKRWTIDKLPAEVRMWIEMYGARSVFECYPGTKLNLLLQDALQARGIHAGYTVCRSLVPVCMPLFEIKGFPGERVSTRLRRYNSRAALILSRLHFHFVEGIRFAWEFRRWRRRLSQVAG
jgi:Uncharacterised nucleotidyltransferase